MQGRGLWIPLVEIADDADRIGVWRPHGKRHPRLTVDFGDVGAQFFVDAGVRSLIKEVEIEISQQAIRIRGARRRFGGFGYLLHCYPQS